MPTPFSGWKSRAVFAMIRPAVACAMPDKEGFLFATHGAELKVRGLCAEGLSYRPSRILQRSHLQRERSTSNGPRDPTHIDCDLA